MDRQAWIAVTLCVIGLVAWQFYMASHAPRVQPTAAVATPSASPAPEAQSAPSATPTRSPVGDAAVGVAPAPTPAESIETFEEKIEPLRNASVELRLTNRGGGISEVHLLNHADEKGQGAVVLNSADHPPIGAILEQPLARALPEFTATRQADGSVQFERRTPQGIVVQKRFSFVPTADNEDNFVTEMQLDFRNEGAAPYTAAEYFLALGSTVPLHPNDMTVYTRLVWFASGKVKSTDVNWFPAQSYPVIGVEKRGPKEFFQERVNSGDWAGMSNQFFTTLLTPLTAKATEVWARPFDVNHEGGRPLLGLEGAMGMPGFQLQPGETNSLHFQIYAGPKIYNRLAKLEHGEAEIMNFGFFKLISQALLNFLNLLHGWVKNYGFAIILLTACVKGVLWPLQNKANKSMRRMSALAPKMQALKEKYKDDPTRMNTEVMKLYKEHGVNPVGGCLPMMIQIPIFFGLFSMLGQAAELRNASFLWVRDLSQPDTLFTIPGMGWIPILGNPVVGGLPINILPLLMGASNVWLMRMTPNTGDAMQRRVMMFMPLIFLVFCYNFAAALALYYTTQNLFTILQLWHNQRQPAPVLDIAPTTTKRARKGRS
ncbi:MAG: membrane protein insertase YidC [Chthoniobacterales bacterium]|nr:membrane protein insertase YidC [Chthoniobacterales bacterium]